MIGHSLVRVESRIKNFTPPCVFAGHTMHFTTMRTMGSFHTNAATVTEPFAEMFTGYVLPMGVAHSWMAQLVMYYPTIPLGLHDGTLDKYHEMNFPHTKTYGMQLWYMFVAHYQGKPYLLGRLTGDTAKGPLWTPITRFRWFLAQASDLRLDLGRAPVPCFVWC